MILTGWRRGEVLGLRWSEFNLPRRTARWLTPRGASLRPLSELACAVIQSQSRIGDVVFAGRTGETPIVGYPKMWLRIAKLGELSADITPHVLRHSFAPILATTSRRSPACSAARPTAYQQVHAFRRCRGERHHEADGIGSGSHPSCEISSEMDQPCGTELPLYRCFRDTGIRQVPTSATASAISPCGTGIESVYGLIAGSGSSRLIKGADLPRPPTVAHYSGVPVMHFYPGTPMHLFSGG
jgi:Phage integrase family